MEKQWRDNIQRRQRANTLSKRSHFKIYVDGSGPNGEGMSGCAFVRYRVDKCVERAPGWTSNEAEYHGLILALKALPLCSHATILSDSQLMVRQWNGEYAVNEPRLAALRSEAKKVIAAKQLKVKLEWIRQSEIRPTVYCA